MLTFTDVMLINVVAWLESIGIILAAISVQITLVAAFLAVRR